MEKLSIRAKMGIVSAIAIFGILISGAIHEWYVWETSLSTIKVEQMQASMEDLDSFSTEIMSNRLLAEDYIYNNNKDALAEKLNSDKTIMALQISLKKDFSKLDKERVLLEEAEKGVTSYNSIFAILKDYKKRIGLDEKSGLQGKVRKSAHKVENILAKTSKIKELIISMLILKQHEKDFMFKQGDEYLTKFDSQFGIFMKILKKHDSISSELKAEIVEAMKNYKESFSIYVEEKIKLHSEKETLGNKNEENISILNKVDKSFKKVLTVSKEEIKSIQTHLTYVFWISMLAVLIILSITMISVIKAITSPLAKIVDSMQDLSEHKITPVNIETKGTISLMVKALSNLQEQIVSAFAAHGVLAQSPIPIMIADKDSLTITYINKSLEHMFVNVEQHLPCKASELIGKNIDIFHKQPSHQRQMLADKSRFPLKSGFKIGDMYVAFSADILNNIDGEWDSIVVTWEDVTETKRIETDFKSGVGKNIQDVIAGVATASAQVETLSAMAEETSAQAELVTQAAADADSNVSTVAAAAEELSASIGEITRQVRESVDLSSDAVVQTDSANKIMQKLEQSSSQIGDIIKVISDIAEQTNLLALNASIEAARAGDAGRGFAVVAGEVKELASQTTEATDRISSQVSSIQKDSLSASQAIIKVSESIGSMNKSTSAIAMAAEEQNDATNEISKSVQFASEASNRTMTAIASVAEAASEQSKAVVETKMAIDGIHSKTDETSESIDTFIKSL